MQCFQKLNVTSGSAYLETLHFKGQRFWKLPKWKMMLNIHPKFSKKTHRRSSLLDIASVLNGKDFMFMDPKTKYCKMKIYLMITLSINPGILVRILREYFQILIIVNMLFVGEDLLSKNREKNIYIIVQSTQQQRKY